MKKVLCILLCITMLITLMPAAAFANPLVVSENESSAISQSKDALGSLVTMDVSGPIYDTERVHPIITMDPKANRWIYLGSKQDGNFSKLSKTSTISKADFTLKWSDSESYKFSYDSINPSYYAGKSGTGFSISAQEDLLFDDGYAICFSYDTRADNFDANDLPKEITASWIVDGVTHNASIAIDMSFPEKIACGEFTQNTSTIYGDGFLAKKTTEGTVVKIPYNEGGVKVTGTKNYIYSDSAYGAMHFINVSPAQADNVISAAPFEVANGTTARYTPFAINFDNLSLEGTGEQSYTLTFSNKAEGGTNKTIILKLVASLDEDIEDPTVQKGNLYQVTWDNDDNPVTGEKVPEEGLSVNNTLTWWQDYRVGDSNGEHSSLTTLKVTATWGTDPSNKLEFVCDEEANKDNWNYVQNNLIGIYGDLEGYFSIENMMGMIGESDTSFTIKAEWESNNTTYEATTTLNVVNGAEPILSEVVLSKDYEDTSYYAMNSENDYNLINGVYEIPYDKNINYIKDYVIVLPGTGVLNYLPKDTDNKALFSENTITYQEEGQGAGVGANYTLLSIDFSKITESNLDNVYTLAFNSEGENAGTTTVKVKFVEGTELKTDKLYCIYSDDAVITDGNLKINGIYSALTELNMELLQSSDFYFAKLDENGYLVPVKITLENARDIFSIDSVTDEEGNPIEFQYNLTANKVGEATIKETDGELSLSVISSLPSLGFYYVNDRTEQSYMGSNFSYWLAKSSHDGGKSFYVIMENDNEYSNLKLKLEVLDEKDEWIDVTKDFSNRGVTIGACDTNSVDGCAVWEIKVASTYETQTEGFGDRVNVNVYDNEDDYINDRWCYIHGSDRILNSNLLSWIDMGLEENKDLSIDENTKAITSDEERDIESYDELNGIVNEFWEEACFIVSNEEGKAFAVKPEVISGDDVISLTPSSKGDYIYDVAYNAVGQAILKATFKEKDYFMFVTVADDNQLWYVFMDGDLQKEGDYIVGNPIDYIDGPFNQFYGTSGNTRSMLCFVIKEGGKLKVVEPKNDSTTNGYKLTPVDYETNYTYCYDFTYGEPGISTISASDGGKEYYLYVESLKPIKNVEIGNLEQPIDKLIPDKEVTVASDISDQSAKIESIVEWFDSNQKPVSGVIPGKGKYTAVITLSAPDGFGFSAWAQIHGGFKRTDFGETWIRVEKTFEVTESKSENPGTSSGGGGGGGGGAPAAPAEKPSAEPTQSGNATTTDMSGSTVSKGGQTTTTVDKQAADKLVETAVANKSEEIVISAVTKNQSAASGTKSSEVALPADTLQTIAEKTNADIVIKTDVAEVKLDNKAAEAVASQAQTGTAGKDETVSIVAEKVKEEAKEVRIELKVVTSGGAVISDFKGGNATVTVNVPKSLSNKKIVCVYIDENGHMHKMDGGLNSDGTYNFTTGHFSTYAIMSEEEVNEAIKEQKKAVKALKLKLRTQLIKTKSGKKAVKLTWTNPSDIELDGVEIYRSVKKNSGYGKKPIYVSKSGMYINTAVKPGKKYYYKVRGFVTIDGEKVYTDYSYKAYRTVK